MNKWSETKVNMNHLPCFYRFLNSQVSIHGKLSNHIVSGRILVKSSVKDFMEIANTLKMVALCRTLTWSFLPQDIPSHFFSSMICEYHWWPSIFISLCISTSFGKVNFGFHWFNPASGNTNNGTPQSLGRMCI